MKKLITLVLLSAVLLNAKPLADRQVSIQFTVTPEMDAAAALHSVTAETVLAGAGKAALDNLVSTAAATRQAQIDAKKQQVLPKDAAAATAAEATYKLEADAAAVKYKAALDALVKP